MTKPSLRLVVFLVPMLLASIASGFVVSSSSTNNGHPFAATTRHSSSSLFASIKNTSPLPKGISPFEKSASKSIDVQGNFRKLAQSALTKAMKDGKTLCEIEFPPLIGGDKSKSQFDDFDNLSELDANRDWCVQFAPTLVTSTTWLVLPDDKETELAKREWTGQRYRSACRFTSIRAALSAVCGGEETMTKAWGSTFASAVNKLQGGDGILADSNALDPLDPTVANRLHLVCQPGNGGPVEDWINVEKLHKASCSQGTATTTAITTCVVNGALDKVRNGFYPALFFPALAATVPFYKQFEPVFWLKPISDKGLYAWLYRVYPEPWQVVLQTAVQEQQRSGKEVRTVVKETVALVSNSRPSYDQAVNALVKAAASQA